MSVRLSLRWYLWTIAGASVLVAALDVTASYAMRSAPIISPSWSPFSPYAGYYAPPPWFPAARLAAYVVIGVVATRVLRRGRAGAIVLVLTWAADVFVGGTLTPGFLPNTSALAGGLFAAWLTGMMSPALRVQEPAELPTQAEMLEAIAATGIGPIATVPDLRPVDDPSARRGAYARRRDG